MMKKFDKTFVFAILWTLVALIFPTTGFYICNYFSFEGEIFRYVISLFLLVGLLPILIYSICTKTKLSDIGFFKPNANLYKFLVIYLPLLGFAILSCVPLAIKGAGIPWNFLFSTILLCLSGAIYEEFYFRGVIQYLVGKLTDRWATIIILTILYVFAHLGFAFFEVNPLLTLLNIITALLFGYIASLLIDFKANILFIIAWHFAVDFINEISLARGYVLNILIVIQIGILIIYAIYLTVLKIGEDKKIEGKKIRDIKVEDKK